VHNGGQGGVSGLGGCFVGSAGGSDTEVNVERRLRIFHLQSSDYWYFLQKHRYSSPTYVLIGRALAYEFPPLPNL
jgi:hypothetical protein